MRGELRRRLLRIEARSAIDRPIRRALLAQAAASIALVFFDETLASGSGLALALLALALAWTGGFFQVFVQRRLGPMGVVIDGILIAGACYPLVLMSANMASFGFVLPLVVAAICVRRPRVDSSAILCVGLLVLASATMAMRIPGRFSPFLALPSLAIGLTVSTWIHARYTRRRLQRRAIRESIEEDGWGLQSRALLGCTFALLLFLMTQVSLRSTEWGVRQWDRYSDLREESKLRGALNDMHSPQENSNSATGRNAQESTSDSQQSDANEESLTHEEVRQGKHGATYFGDELKLTGSLIEAPRSRRVEMRVINPRSKERHFDTRNPAYLMTTSFGEFTQSGLGPALLSPLYSYTDSGDGNTDGWTQIQTDPYYGTYLEIEVRCRNLIAPTTGAIRHVVPRIEPLIAIRQPAVQRRADGMLTLPDLGEFEQISRMRCRTSSVDVLNSTSPSFDRSIASSLELPPRDSAWAPIMEEIRVQIQQLDPSEPVLRAVLGHFRRNYRYSLLVNDQGLPGLTDFLAAREGYCVYFATSALLMLRELGVPCRVASGYRVSRWDDELEAYVAGDQGAHAWVEVHVLGQGWVPFDPTPSLGLEGATAAEMSRLEQLEILAELQGYDQQSLAQIEAAAAAERAAQENQDAENQRAAEYSQADRILIPHRKPSKRSDSSILWVGAAMGALLALVNFARKQLAAKNRGGSGRIDDRELIGTHEYQAIVNDLARLGIHPRRGQTPLEFAHQVAQHFHYPFPAMVPVIWSLYAYQFGQFELTPTDRVRIEELRNAIAQAD